MAEMILPAGTLKRIHVNQSIIRRNRDTGAREPVFTVKHKGETHVARAARIEGHSHLVYSPDKPLSCGARVWIETSGKVYLD